MRDSKRVGKTLLILDVVRWKLLMWRGLRPNRSGQVDKLVTGNVLHFRSDRSAAAFGGQMSLTDHLSDETPLPKRLCLAVWFSMAGMGWGAIGLAVLTYGGQG